MAEMDRASQVLKYFRENRAWMEEKIENGKISAAYSDEHILTFRRAIEDLNNTQTVLQTIDVLLRDDGGRHLRIVHVREEDLGRVATIDHEGRYHLHPFPPLAERAGAKASDPIRDLR